jgi:peptide/nickel transport system substrate-binding protein
MDFIAEPEPPVRASSLLKESGYRRQNPSIAASSTDDRRTPKLPVVAAQLLRQAGFNVDMQSMNWQSLVSRRARKPAGHFHDEFTGCVSVNPICQFCISTRLRERVVRLAVRLRDWRSCGDAFARATMKRTQDIAAEQVQVRAMEIGTHVPLGEYVTVVAVAKRQRSCPGRRP